MTDTFHLVAAVGVLGVGLIAWGIFLLLISFFLLGEYGRVFLNNPWAVMSLEIWSEAASQTGLGSTIVLIFVAGALFVATGVCVILFGVATALGFSLPASSA